MSYCHTNACVVRQHLYNTTAPTVLKTHMEHDLTPGFQNCKIVSGRISKMAAVTKIAKTTKSTSPGPLNIFGYILAWNINETLVFRIVKMKKICGVVVSQ